MPSQQATDIVPIDLFSVGIVWKCSILRNRLIAIYDAVNLTINSDKFSLKRKYQAKWCVSKWNTS